MEFNEKLQELRKRKGLTQEELARELYVSRSAISKWESGRGYPEIQSLKAIARFFSVTLDDLLSTDEILIIAEEDNKKNKSGFLDLAYGLMDICMAMLLFLPFFASRKGGEVLSSSLISLDGVQPYLKTAYFVAVISTVLVGIISISLQNCQAKAYLKYKNIISLLLGVAAVLLFVISSQPYAAIFSFAPLIIKAILLIKRQ